MASLISELMLSEYLENLKSAKAFFITELDKITVEESNKFRGELENAGAKCKIVKNRIAKLALEKLEIKDLDKYLKGSTAAIIAEEDIIAAAKVVVDYEKNLESVKIKAGYLDGKVLENKEVVELSKIPSREVLLAKLLMCMQSPITGFVSVLNGVSRNFVNVLDAIKKQKEN